MRKNPGYFAQHLKNRYLSSVPQPISDLTYVSFCINWESYEIADHFLWPSRHANAYEMKIFAINFLSDYLGEDFKKFSAK
jgi:hypothetical protein